MLSNGLFFVSILTFTIVQPEIALAEDSVIDQWFSQKLDHFNPSNNATWNQRYFINSEFYSPGGPAFLMIGGESKASPLWMNTGQWTKFAKKFNAMCFMLEHRFYGKSKPTKDMSVKNLIYLNSEQALADLAYFISDMNELKFNTTNKWIVFGGSYPGSLAAWMRLKYPHLVHAAVSSSGPLLAKKDFKEYFEVVVDALSTSTRSCPIRVMEAFKNISTMMQSSNGQAELNKIYKLCDPLSESNKLNQMSFYESLAGRFAEIVQYNKDNRVGSEVKLKNVTIDTVCDMMTDESAGSPLQRLANFNDLIMKLNNDTCMDYDYQKNIDANRNDTWNEKEGGRQWEYQSCNEFGFFQTSSGESNIFTENFPISYFVKQCMDIFGKKYDSEYIDEAVKRSNIMYGGLDIKITRTVFVHGSIDPWHALGKLQSDDEDSPAIFINGTAHCADMYPDKFDDLPQLIMAREKIGNLIEKWLGEK